MQQLQQSNPLQPVSMPTVAQQLQQYRQNIANITSQISNGNQEVDSSISQNPWAPDEVTPSQLSKEQVDHKAWLSTQPVSAQNTANQFDQEQHVNILKNLQNDPVFKEIKGPFFEVLDQLRGLVQSGQITHEQAMQHLEEAAPMIDASFEKHHPKGGITESHNLTIDPDLHQTPEMLNKLKATKGGQ